jgi:hypothetical protein
MRDYMEMKRRGKVYLLCKNCSGDADGEKVSGYILDAKDSLRPSSGFSINVAEIRPSSKKRDPVFTPPLLQRIR